MHGPTCVCRHPQDSAKIRAEAERRPTELLSAHKRDCHICSTNSDEVPLPTQDRHSHRPHTSRGVSLVGRCVAVNLALCYFCSHVHRSLPKHQVVMPGPGLCPGSMYREHLAADWLRLDLLSWPRQG